MSNSILIGATKHMDILQERLHNNLKPFEKGGFPVNVNMERNFVGNYTFLSCNFDCKESNNINTIYKDNIANEIYEIIINYWEKIILEKIIISTYYYFEPEERKIILSNALEYVRNNRSYYSQERKDKILDEVNRYLDNNDYIVIDGFIRFRLKEYLQELYDAADKAVDDFLMEREYEEFIQLLKYFVEIQDPYVNQVNVLLNAEGVFELYDENEKSIDEEYIKGCMIEFIASDINYEDLLISSLISIAPREIVLHFTPGESYNTVVETIKKVFTGKVRVCEGCAFCKKYR
ncbi:MAG: putative sporulation protein YtxC [Clostridiales bacterium]|nr:putative sporulation protein YtxC [Clostridiales bacterium]MCF8023124.1 putative sporulation protein YtxC [Clostridiales bacterium]